MPPTLLTSLAKRDTTWLLHEVFADEQPLEAACTSIEAVRPLVEAGLVQSRDGQELCPVGPHQASKIIHAAIDDWLPGVLDAA